MKDSDIAELAEPGAPAPGQEPCMGCARHIASVLQLRHEDSALNTAIAVFTMLVRDLLPPEAQPAVFRATAAGFLRSADFIERDNAIGRPQGNA